MEKMILKCEKIYKSFGPTKALSGASIEVRPGEVHGLIGENGSGKSTWSSIIAGIQKPDTGSMYFSGSPFCPASILEAQKTGIAMIVQEQATLMDITVAANIYLGKEDRFTKAGFVNATAMNRAARSALAKIGITDIEPSELINNLTFEERKIVEIARAMDDAPRLLIIDETTTALATNGRNLLYTIMNQLKDNGKAVLFVSHDLEELIATCDRITVLRDGVVVSTLSKEELSIKTLRRLMVGREIEGSYYRSGMDGSSSEEVALSVKNVTAGMMLENVTFNLHKGEILGIGGLNDSGMHDLGKVIFGMMKTIAGEVRIGESGEIIRNSKKARRHRIGYIPKNRDQEALILEACIKDNAVLASLSHISRNGWIKPKREDAFAAGVTNEMNVKCRSINQNVNELSGGNKQKVVFGKWLGNNTEIFIMDCPTRGIDIGVKADMYKLIYELKASGKSILLISEELPELIGMSDRIIILKEGKISGEFAREEQLTEHKLIDYLI